MSAARIGVIGGTGLYAMEDLEVLDECSVETPFGSPSDAYVIGKLGGTEIVFLPRHGRGHRLLPSELNFRANIFGFKELGVTRLISVSAVGSMKEEYSPADVVIPDQFFDRTRQRPATFFGEGVVVHVSMADPTCPVLTACAADALSRLETPTHFGGTYICIEGPQFSTRAESMVYRQWGMDVIGMTNLPEAKLAREAELCFLCLAMVTDWDCWKDDEEAVSADSVFEILARNTKTAQTALRVMVERLDSGHDAGICGCNAALETALVTDLNQVAEARLDALGPLLTRYRP